MLWSLVMDSEFYLWLRPFWKYLTNDNICDFIIRESNMSYSPYYIGKNMWMVVIKNIYMICHSIFQ